MRRFAAPLLLAVAIASLPATGRAEPLSGPDQVDASDRPQIAELPELAGWRSRFEARTFRSTSGIVPYQVAMPPVTSPRPLVVVLPGKWEMGRDNKSQLTPFVASWAQLHDDGPDAPIIVAPQVKSRSVNYRRCHKMNCASRVGRSFKALLELLDFWTAHKAVDKDRVHLVGFSMGGGTALQLALARPQVPAAVAAFGAVPPPRQRAPELKSQNLLVVLGTQDRNHPLPVMREWVDALNASGGKATLDVREGMEHQVPDDMVIDKAWRLQLAQQRRVG